MKEYFVCVYILFIVEVLYLTDAGGEFLWRMKREANITEIKCCMQEGIPTGKRGLRDSIEMRDIGKICFEEIQNKSSDINLEELNLERRVVFLECQLQCVFDKLKKVNEEGNLKKEETASSMIGLFMIADRKFGDIFIEKCWKNLEGHAETKVEGHVCNPAAFNIYLCFEDIANLLCPEKYEKKNAECENHRVKLKNKYGEPQKDVSKTDGE
uniref:Chemosensory protein n=1 Tax=Blattella germanica TaxID=6973 RepID=A0A109Z5A7_BLAGE|nr:chemosensory protein [Blattella germanica]